jgi:CHAT domain-containing protein
MIMENIVSLPKYQIIIYIFVYLLAFGLTIPFGCSTNYPLTKIQKANEYDSLGTEELWNAKYEQAMTYFRMGESIYIEIQDHERLYDEYENIAIVYNYKNMYDSAIWYHKLALTGRKITNNKEKIAKSYNNIGEVLKSLNQYATSNKYLDSSLTVLKEIGDSINFIKPFVTKGLNYSYLGQYEEALTLHQDAYKIAGIIGDSAIICASLMNLGYDYFNLHQFDEAISCYKNALAISTAMGDDEYTGTTFGLFAWALNEKGDYGQALKYADSALTLSFTKIDSGVSYYKLGMIYQKTENFQDAIDNFHKALYLFRQINAREREGMVCYKLMLLFSQINKPDAAILYGKQAVNILQQIRSSIKELNQNVQKDYLKSKEDVYRELADILISQDRLPEARQIIEMLKQEEYYDYVRGNSNYANSLDEKINYAQSENVAQVNISSIMDNLARYSIEMDKLRKKGVPLLADDSTRYSFLQDNIIAANKEFNKNLDSLRIKFEKSPQEYMRYLDLGRSDDFVRILRQMGTKSVLVYTLLEKSKYNIILFTSEIKKWKSFTIKSADLSRDLIKYSEILRDTGSNPKIMGKILYDKIFKPLENDLKIMKVEEIFWSLDGALRYIPISALYDGNKYVVEKYRTIIVDPFKLYRLVESKRSDWQIMGFGVSKPHPNFRALPYAWDELNGIIRDDDMLGNYGFLPGVIRLDEKFTRKSFLDALRKPLPVVHIASHFNLNNGDYSSSSLLLGDGKQMSMEDLEDQSIIFSDIKLLTLSACNTAATANSDGKEVEGFATHAQNKGAEAVLASLWSVDDESTAELMKNFYFIKNNPKTPSIAHALDSAQISLLRGRIMGGSLLASRGSANRGREDSSTVSTNSAKSNDSLTRYSHPFYWAPFVLVGNGK